MRALDRFFQIGGALCLALLVAILVFNPLP
jgi:hypothetical protein